MSEAGYRPEQIGDYGMRQQPALIERMTPHLKLTQLGNGFAWLAVFGTLAGVLTYPVFTDRGLGYPIAALVCSAVLLLICTFQLVAWRMAMAEWRAEHDFDLAFWARISWVAHLFSYVVVIAAMWVSITAVLHAGSDAAATTFLMVSLILMVAAQISAGVQYLRAGGPPGTLPAHMRNLVARAERSRRGE